MVRGLYTAASGMFAMQHQIDVTSNNIANVNTTGFKKDRAEFQDLMYETLNYTASRTTQNTTNPTGIQVGLGVRLSNIQKEFTQGDLRTTNGPLDVNISGTGFFQITLPNGEIGYTRNGNFKLNNEGVIVTGNGYPLEPEIVLPQNVKDTSVTIGKDGIVTGKDAQTQATIELGQITLADFVNPQGLSAVGDSLFMETEASGAPIVGNPATDQFGALQQGVLETSNVQLVNEMVELITAQRAYEANSKAITTADSMLDTTNRLKS